MYYSGCCGGPAAFDIVEVLGCGRRWPGSMTLRRSHEVHEDTRSYSCTDHVSCLGVAAARGQRLLARPIFRAYESKLLALKEYIKESVYLARISLLPNEARKALQCGDLRVVTTQYYRSVARWGSGTHYYCNI